MQSLNDRINQIADDYMVLSGKGNAGKALLTPQEYLLFRQQAIEELKLGLFSVGSNAGSQTTAPEVLHPEPVNTIQPQQSCVIPMKSPDPKPKPQTQNQQGVIPFHNEKTDNNVLLSMMKSVEC